MNTLLTVNAGDDVVFSPEVEGGMLELDRPQRLQSDIKRNYIQ